jgi:hypothetical protein
MTSRAQPRRGTQSSALLIERWFTARMGHAGLYLVNKPDPKIVPDPNVPA